MSSLIEVRHLCKDFGDIRAVDDLSFDVPAGQVYGFLGQNGAGKSTTIRMLLTLIQPSAGDIRLFGMDLRRHRKEILRQVGAIIERPDMYRYLSGLENLRLFATLSGVRLSQRQLMEQLELVGLAARAHHKVKTYSQGMKQRLGIAVALAHDPQLILLDEPTNGLDPQGIADIRHLILHLCRDRKKTLLISSHLLSEMELIADSMLIIDKGKKLVEGAVKDLFDPAATLMELHSGDDARTWELLQADPALRPLLKQQRRDCLVLQLHRDAIPGVIRQIVEKGIDLHSFHALHSLEDYFLSLTAPAHVETAAT